jgi:trans-2,3-dihydro-3-hydroxyanthranilate isomerase
MTLAMAAYRFLTVDVFTHQRFGGNPLAVFPDARGLSSEQMLSLAREFNLSETTFVLPPQDSANTAQVRIFNPTTEMPFAGHPNVGTGYVLASQGLAKGDIFRFEEIAGLVEIRIERDGAGAPTGAVIAAPQPLSVGAELPIDAIAACAGIAPQEVLGAPIIASTGNPFIFAEITGDALTRARPDLAAFRALKEAHPELLADKASIHLYARGSDRLRSRMFAPLAGIMEDPATGSANVTLGALLLSEGGGEEAAYEIVQGVEMGRPSLLRVTARRGAEGIRATVGGGCVPVLSGEAQV